MIQSRTAHQQMMHISAMMSLMLCPSTITRASVFSAGWGAFDGTVEGANTAEDAGAAEDAGRGAFEDAGRGAFEDAGWDAVEDAGWDAVEDAGWDAVEDAGADSEASIVVVFQRHKEWRKGVEILY